MEAYFAEGYNYIIIMVWIANPKALTVGWTHPKKWITYIPDDHISHQKVPSAGLGRR